MLRFPLVPALLCLVATGVPASAQSFTDDELLQVFRNQRDAFRAASESGVGQTRGLTLVTVDDVEVATEAAEPTTSGDTGGGVTVELEPLTLDVPDQAQTGTPEEAPKQVVFGQLAPELQINVNIRFAFDSAALTEDQKPLLAQLCSVMRESDIQLFRIAGHTDASGSDAYNERLSQLRAEEVQRYLVRDCGIAATRLEAVGLGERFLADQADPKAPENRRVEFQALS
ncbi:OmpA family protein [Defluviimonas aestuarii]|uniref:OmpA family protein n=1 Tax=Albidovulum aestuarii TaxID=1130726 RepID=UPI00249C8616|nr:OmpA family protein [Defluviimonas aestuarii]MDI3337745.1 OmpA family protein [Defluviimonas aestuarii]